MQNKRKNTTTITLILLILLVVVATTILLGRTFAKYTSSSTGTDTATVATWSFEVNDEQIATSSAKTLNINIFDTIKDSDRTSAESDVTSNKIAPGTSGSFDIKVDNTSDVTAKCTIAFSATNASNIPLEYQVVTKGGAPDEGSWTKNITEENVTIDSLAKTTGTDTRTVYWRWAFDGNDTSDTNLGIAAQSTAPTAELTVTVTATQVD